MYLFSLLQNLWVGVLCLRFSPPLNFMNLEYFYSPQISICSTLDAIEWCDVCSVLLWMTYESIKWRLSLLFKGYTNPNILCVLLSGLQIFGILLFSGRIASRHGWFLLLKTPRGQAHARRPSLSLIIKFLEHFYHTKICIYISKSRWRDFMFAPFWAFQKTSVCVDGWFLCSIQSDATNTECSASFSASGLQISGIVLSYTNLCHQPQKCAWRTRGLLCSAFFKICRF